MTTPDHRRHRILVADDEPDIVELLQTLLGLAEYEIITATDGLQALTAIRDERPDGVILDINMPRLDGFGVLEALQRDPPPTQPKILVLTARYSVDDVDRAMALGATDFLAKPFSNKTLLIRVLRLVREDTA